MEKISGYVEHIIYRNTGNGYSVFELVAEGEEVTCVGTFRALDEGENLELTGGYVEHAVYGSQFKVESYEAVALRMKAASNAIWDPAPSRGSARLWRPVL